MERQRYIFNYEPYEKITTLLTDFRDYGNAAATTVPRNTLLFDIAPVSTTFETFTGSERFYMLMNHELVHIVTMDQATEADKRMRKLFAKRRRFHVRPRRPYPPSRIRRGPEAPNAEAP